MKCSCGGQKECGFCREMASRHPNQCEVCLSFASNFNCSGLEASPDCYLHSSFRAVASTIDRAEEMRKLTEVGIAAANETLAMIGPGIPPFDPTAPGVASFFAGVAAMIVESKG